MLLLSDVTGDVDGHGAVPLVLLDAGVVSEVDERGKLLN